MTWIKSDRSSGQLCDSARASQYHHPMPNGSLSLADYPAAMVQLKCWKCDRSGQYRKVTLIEKYGADVPLPDLLHLVRANCPKTDRLCNDPCGVCYGDL